MNVFGKWELIPELCQYQVGNIPDQATYEIVKRGEDIVFTVEWSADGQDLGVTFSAPADGSIEPSDNDMPAHRIIPINDNQLDGEALVEDHRVAYASRKVSADGQLLSVLQVNGVGSEHEHRIFQVYRRLS